MDKTDVEELKIGIYGIITDMLKHAIACDPNLTKRDLEMFAIGMECGYYRVIPDEDLLELSMVVDVKIQEIMADTKDSPTNSACLTPADIPSLF